MKLNKFLLPLAVLLPLATCASAQVLQDVTDYARVISVSPQPGPDITRRECHSVSYERPAERSATGAVVGGVLGAVVGSRFGSGHGRDAATVVGAIGGAIAGDKIGNNDVGGTSTREQCEDVRQPGPPAGYNVTIEYEGRQQNVFMHRHPGNRVRVHRTVSLES